MNRKTKDLIVKMLKFLPDKTYLKLRFRFEMKQKLNLKNPQTFNEKLQWLKLYDRQPIYTTMVDKYAVKKYVADIIGEEYIIPTLGVWDKFDDIDFDKLPNQFVLKATAGGGSNSVYICKDKATFDFASAKKQNLYYNGREWPYKNVPRKIIAEELLDLNENTAEFKMFCSYGKMNWVMLCTGNSILHNRTNDGYDKDFNHLPIEFTYKNAEEHMQKPKVWDELVNIAEILSKDIPQVRIDTYVLGDKVYFGEITLYHCSGFCNFNPLEWDLKFGKQIDLSKVKG